MKGRILLTGLVAGIALFVWLAIAHIALPLGRTGISEIPNEDVAMAAMSANIHQPGFYIFPSGGMLSAKTPEEQRAAQELMMKKSSAGPRGILVYHPEGASPMSARQLITELEANIAEAMLAVWIISFAVGLSFGGRVFLGAIIGLAGSMMTNISYWNWYGFPGRYTAANMLIQVVGFAVVGLVAALMLPKHPKAKEIIGAGK
jgi:hypothetical protein